MTHIPPRCIPTSGGHRDASSYVYIWILPTPTSNTRIEGGRRGLESEKGSEEAVSSHVPTSDSSGEYTRLPYSSVVERNRKRGCEKRTPSPTSSLLHSPTQPLDAARSHSVVPPLPSFNYHTHSPCVTVPPIRAPPPVSHLHAIARPLSDDASLTRLLSTDYNHTTCQTQHPPTAISILDTAFDSQLLPALAQPPSNSKSPAAATTATITATMT
ncbi:hypothetical protein BDN71DRAFT_1507515 [Pleurotus eryngii]|uniref:Uncharacterized protein n=1 Tax=Pleurotus eryngii TaxID=5323 RepID=A0A9P6DG68_PLEER|nr:hypothetical protein BDN71DRAFT_1507515 [Pleurotus eryngii]